MHYEILDVGMLDFQPGPNLEWLTSTIIFSLDNPGSFTNAVHVYEILIDLTVIEVGYQQLDDLNSGVLNLNTFKANQIFIIPIVNIAFIVLEDFGAMVYDVN